MKYTSYNENNELTGFYSKDIHGDNIPENSIEITDELWQEILNNGNENYRVDLNTNTVIPYIKPIKEQISIKYNNLLLSIKSKAKLLILNQYPEWKQLNLTNDTEIAKQSIVQLEELGGYDILADDVMKNVTMKIGFSYTYQSLKSIEDDYINFDVSDLTLVTDEDLRIRIELYYKKIILAYVVYRRIEIIRDISNIKENEIKTIYNNTSISDEEKLNQLTNYDISFEGIEN